MATRKTAKKAPAARKQPASAASELEVLHPERRVSIQGRRIEVREYGYIEGLQMQAGAQDFLQALYALVDGASAPPPAHAVRQVFARFAVNVQWMIAQAITPIDEADPKAYAAALDESARWVAKLDDIKGDALTAAWWEVNKGFFTRRIRELRMAAIDAAAAANPSAPAGSTQP